MKESRQRVPPRFRKTSSSAFGGLGEGETVVHALEKPHRKARSTLGNLVPTYERCGSKARGEHTKGSKRLKLGEQ